MHALILIAHPNEDSFSHAMAAVTERVLVELDHDVARHDLYAERFDPIQPAGEIDNTRSSDPLVEAHCAAVARADLIAVFHPNWWGQPPAILKGWVDRVLRLETAYRYPPGVGFAGTPEGLLQARCAMVFNTSNTPAARESEVFGDPLEILEELHLRFLRRAKRHQAYVRPHGRQHRGTACNLARRCRKAGQRRRVT